MLTVRPLHREDRDQLTELVNAHVAAVLPGVSVSVNTVLSQLARRPDESITDPVADLPITEPPPGVTIDRALDECGTRLTARTGGRPPGSHGRYRSGWSPGTSTTTISVPSGSASHISIRPQGSFTGGRCTSTPAAVSSSYAAVTSAT